MIQGETMQHAAVERVIADMWDRYDEPLSLADMADVAIVSRFYFSRIFRAITGTSPGRFLTAIRLYKAKNLLLETSLSVTEISFRVGYNSLGTFTSRFTRSVGVSPARYRAMARGTGFAPPPKYLDEAGNRPGTVRGRVTVPPSDLITRIYVGGFPGPIPEGTPVACDILESGGEFRLERMPAGDWHVLAAAVAVRDMDPRPWIRRPLFVGQGRPVHIPPGGTVTVDVHLRPVRATDLPILVALPELDSHEPVGRVAA
jgi:AraC-like DNA-binding protein